MKEQQKKRKSSGTVKFIIGFGLGAVVTALFYRPLVLQNRDLRVKYKIQARRTKSLENRADNNLLRGIRIGEERKRN